MPAFAVALVAVLGGAALVLDRLWLDTVHTELQTVAEAAALAAGQVLASDDLLRRDCDPHARLARARFAAARIALHNGVIGEPQQLDINPEGDVRFGKLVEDSVTGEPLLLETDSNPTTVAVSARRTREQDSAVPLPLRSLLGPDSADVVAVAEATLDNQIVGLRAIESLQLPTLPLGILYEETADRASVDRSTRHGAKHKSPHEASQDRLPTWKRDIEEHRGLDRFSIDGDGRVSEGSDGIPEIVLRTSCSSTKSDEANAFVLTPTSTLTQDDLRRHVRDGWSADDLPTQGELLFDQGPLTLAGLSDVDAATMAEALRNVIGQPRICVVYDRATTDRRSQVSEVRCIGLIAGRVMSARELSANSCEIVLQPTVMACRAAVLASEVSGEETSSVCELPRNPYIYKLRLTH